LTVQTACGRMLVMTSAAPDFCPQGSWMRFQVPSSRQIRK
jgi:hypothetical protein